MEMRKPELREAPALRSLWQQAFGDPDSFLELFFRLGFSPDRCRCAWEGERLLAALYWFDVETAGQKQAYLYGVATDAAFRGRGICRELMADTHAHLRENGYTGALLVPDGERLGGMYGRMGYSFFGGQKRFSCEAGENAAELRHLQPEEYAALRRAYLPENGVVQESSLAFQTALMDCYAGEGFLLTGWREGDSFLCPELLGDGAKAPEAVKALGCRRGSFRIPGTESLFAMFLPLRPNACRPEYFGLAFD